MSAALISVHNVSVALSHRQILRELSFELPRQNLVALVGPNGAGKTTLLRTMAGLLRPSGEVLIEGKSVHDLSAAQRALKFGYLPQGHVVHWPLPAHDIVALGRYPHGATDPSRLPPADEAAVARAMQATDTVAFADRPVTELSGGERSRVALARVLAVEAQVVLADEPTAFLDPRHQLDVMQLLRKAADGGTLVIVVTHDLGLAARYADAVLVMADGQLAAHGPPREALSEQVLANVFRVQAFRAQRDDGAVIVPWSAT
jgi:iron complex transport system ATP-binding protein